MRNNRRTLQGLYRKVSSKTEHTRLCNCSIENYISLSLRDICVLRKLTMSAYVSLVPHQTLDKQNLFQLIERIGEVKEGERMQQTMI